MSSEAAPVGSIPLEDIFRHLKRSNAVEQKWMVSLGTKKWQKAFVVLTLYDECEDGKMAWVHSGGVDAVQPEKSLFGDFPCLAMLVATDDEARIFVVDVRNFNGASCKCFCSTDQDDLVKGLKAAAREKDYDEISSSIALYIETRHSQVY